MDWKIIILSNAIIVPVSYLIGHTLRAKIVPERRIWVGFIVVLIILSLALLMGLLFPFMIRLLQLISSIAIGFPLGLAGPPLEKRREDK